MFGVSGLRVDQLRQTVASSWAVWTSYSVWSAVWIMAHALGGAAIGSLFGGLGRICHLLGQWTRWILAGLLVFGGFRQLGFVRFPMLDWQRQVPRHWMKWRLEWTAVGYGLQLGSAVCTRITNFATYAALAATFLTQSVFWGAITMLIFGIFRSLPAVLSGPFAYTPQRSFQLAMWVGNWETEIHRYSGVLLFLYGSMLAIVRRG